jgi:putative exosortase-associated protein (TIGR04073 family)
MKKFLVLALLVLTSGLSFAAEMEEGGPLRKLQRGFVNIALSPMELTSELAIEKHENNDQMPPSWMTGTVRGIVFTAGRALAGVYDIATFPISLPKDYAPLIQPEFPWDRLKSSPTVQNK